MDHQNVKTRPTGSAHNTQATVVLNGAPPFSLSSITGVDFMNEKYDTVTSSGPFVSESGIILDPASRGLVLSVGDHINGNQVGLANVSSVADIQITNSIISSTHGGVIDSERAPQLFAIHQDRHGNVTLLDEETVIENLQLTNTNHGGQVAVVPVAPVTAEEDNKFKAEKRKGGWPKGKRRKPEKVSKGPKAPATAYVLYATQRRQAIKKINQNLSFPEVTKILGQEWSAMSQEERQKYIDESEADKKRYAEELKQLQQSDDYQNYLRRKKMKKINDDSSGANSGEFLMQSNPYYAEDVEDEGLYCKICDQYFSSHHNRKEHMFGKQHLQNLTNEFEKELHKEDKSNGENPGIASSDVSQEPLQSVSSSQLLLGPHCSSSVDIASFIQNFMEKNHERELEILMLQKTVEESKTENEQLLTKIHNFKEEETKLEQDIGNLKAYGAALTAQIDGLKMVPTLFGVINF